MTNFIFGFIFGISALLLFSYIIGTFEDRRLKKEIGEDYVHVFIPKSKIDNNHNIIMDFSDETDVTVHKDLDKNILGFSTCSPKLIENADFYYSLLNNKQRVTIVYEQHKYKAVVTQIKFIDTHILDIYYTVINI